MERLSESISLFKVLDTHANLDSKRSLGECLSVHAWPRLGINLQILPFGEVWWILAIVFTKKKTLYFSDESVKQAIQENLWYVRRDSEGN